MMIFMAIVEQLSQRHCQKRRDVGRWRPRGKLGDHAFDQRAASYGCISDVLHRCAQARQFVGASLRHRPIE